VKGADRRRDCEATSEIISPRQIGCSQRASEHSETVEYRLRVFSRRSWPVSCGADGRPHGVRAAQGLQCCKRYPTPWVARGPHRRRALFYIKRMRKFSS